MYILSIYIQICSISMYICSCLDGDLVAVEAYA